jgi:hypothetical protein
VVSRRACEFEVRFGLTLQKGLEDVVGDQHKHLSGGEQAPCRVRIAPQAAIAVDEQHRAYVSMEMTY